MFETFLTPPEVPQMICDLWRDDDEFMNWVENRRAEREGRRWFYKGQPEEELLHNTIEVMGEHFVAARSDDSIRLYAIQDADARVVKPVSASDPNMEVARTLKDTLLQDGCVLNPQRTETMRNLFTCYASLDERPALCAQPDQDAWCLHKMSVRSDPSMPTPATDQFLERLNDCEAFAAWLYGIASGKYRGRQVLWIEGDGEDGKSTFMMAFASLFGTTAGSADWATMKNAPQFVAGLFVDKKFVYVPDNANPYLLMTEIFKTLANPGADPVTVNQKYGKMYTTTLEAHVAVLSNHAPEISGERHNVSRTLWLRLAEFTGERDPNYGARLRAELPGLLAYGEKCYAKLCQNDYVIAVNDAVQAAMAERIADTNETFELLFEKNFVLDPAGTISRSEFRDILKEEARLSNQEIGNFKRWLRTAHKVEAKQGTTGARSYRGIRRIQAADMRKKITLVTGTNRADAFRA
ncbi:DUF5906 domain-containing protein [Methylorubrum aminovorans]|uniref:DUF5906 domain-containing protein n=1 Tax=Methylorubrum aminovorans TaxID=269069 RepID=UPI003C2EF8A0